MFNANLFKLKDELFLDIVPSECKFDPSRPSWSVLLFSPAISCCGSREWNQL